MGWLFEYSSWRDLWVPALIGTAAVLVALAAWRTAHETKRVAERAEEAEARRHEADLKARYEERLNEALADFVRAITGRVFELGERLGEIEHAKRTGATVPSSVVVGWAAGHEAVSVLRLFAQGDDVAVAWVLTDVLLAIDDLLVQRQAPFVGQLHNMIRDWRSAGLSAEATATRIRALGADVLAAKP